MPVETPSLVPVCASRRRASIALAAALSWSAMWVPAHATGEATVDDTANCIAVMQPHADQLARQIKAGDTAREPVLQSELTRGAALIGRSYLDGVRDSRVAKARLNAAKEGQANWDDERKNRVHQACLKRADAELAAASGPQRFIVERYAHALLKHMLKEP
jgi:hypothetical protein